MGEVGLFIKGQRPKSKKQVKDTIAAGEIATIEVEGTSFFPGSTSSFSGPLTEVMEKIGGKTLVFVGPDPYSKRNFFGQIKIVGGKVKVS